MKGTDTLAKADDVVVLNPEEEFDTDDAIAGALAVEYARSGRHEFDLTDDLAKLVEEKASELPKELLEIEDLDSHISIRPGFGIKCLSKHEIHMGKYTAGRNFPAKEVQWINALAAINSLVANGKHKSLLTEKEGVKQTPETYLGKEALARFKRFFASSKEHARVLAKYRGWELTFALRIEPSLLGVKKRHLIKALDLSITELLKWVVVEHFNEPHKRGFYDLLHICLWKRYQNDPFYSCDARVVTDNKSEDFVPNNEIHPVMREFLDANKELFDLVEDLLKTHFPAEWFILDRARHHSTKAGLPFLCGIYPGLALNFNCQTTRHLDCGDWPLGLCCVIVWGKVEGGDLVLEGIDCIFEMPDCSILFFRSAMLIHSNLEFKSKYIDGRRSLVLFACSDLLNWAIVLQGSEKRPNLDALLGKQQGH
ncbi:hypothetical protein HK097_002975 [Rhizophlyctis rosea]|uniref:Uncharacterized protein n=1 Tax=Rhizophlyctis rosea TaxID=64517 RepID=A0AAD5X6C9_9FUNG|nr:hypothetical protein HK097_002975 [Rhizophlyctis rosea]